MTTIRYGGSTSTDSPVLVMHYGTPHTGNHPPRIAAQAQEYGVRLLSVTRPGFAGSPRRRDRTVVDSATEVIEVLDRLGIERVSTVGYSGGGPHALALAALLRDRITHVGTFACPAPYDSTPAWFSGMSDGGGGLRAASAGRTAREHYQQTAEFNPSSFTEDDWTALSGQWSEIGEDAQAAGAAGSDFGEIDDDLAFIKPWGVDLAQISGSVTLFHARADRVVPSHHAKRLAALLPSAAVRLIDKSGHVAVLDHLPTWIRTLAPTEA